MTSMADDLMFDNTTIIPLYEVMVDHGSFKQAYHVFGQSTNAAITALESSEDLSNSSVISVSRYYGYGEDYSNIYNKGFRIVGIEEDTDRIVIRGYDKDRNYQEFRIHVILDSDWIESAWQRIQNMVD